MSPNTSLILFEHDQFGRAERVIHIRGLFSEISSHGFHGTSKIGMYSI